MPERGENPVNAKEAARILAGGGKPWARSTMSGIKRQMGITSRLFYVSDVRKFIAATPDFSAHSAYRGKSWRLVLTRDKNKYKLTVPGTGLQEEGTSLVEVMAAIGRGLQETAA